MIVDLREDLEKGPRTIEQTVYHNNGYVGFASRQDKAIGISFVGVVNGAARRYHTGSNTFYEALRFARKNYGVKLPLDGWLKLRLKVYSNTATGEIIKILSNENFRL